MTKNSNYKKAFTIVELLVVIVVIGILAAITIVAYTSIRQRAVASIIKSQLSDDSKVLKMYYIDNSLYPNTLDSNYCPATPVANTSNCLKSPKGSTLTYTGTNSTFIVTIRDIATDIAYSISQDDVVAIVPSTPPSISSFVSTMGVAGEWDGAYDLIQTVDGGYFTAGEVQFTSRYSTALLAKYDNAGTLSWSKAWESTVGRNSANSVAQTSDNGYIITGRTDTFDVIVPSNAYLAKYDSAGNLSWSKVWGGGSSFNRAAKIIQTIDDGYAITGVTYNYGAGSGDIFITKYDSTGELVWNKTWGGALLDRPYSIIQNLAGEYLVVGETGNYGAGSNDAIIIAYDSVGNLLWNKTLGGINFENAMDIVQSSDGSYALTGMTTSYGNGGTEAYIAKFSSIFDLNWTKTWGGASTDQPYSIAKTSDNGYVIAGKTNSFGAGNDDVFIVKYNSTGDILWDATWGGTDDDSAAKVIQSSDGNYVVAGETNSYGDIEFDTLLIKYKSDGTISGCSSPMCQNQSVIATSPTMTITSPTAITTTPGAVLGTPSVTESAPLTIPTVVVAPL